MVEWFNDRSPHHLEPAAQIIPDCDTQFVAGLVARLRNPSRQSRPISLRVPALIAAVGPRSMISSSAARWGFNFETRYLVAVRMREFSIPVKLKHMRYYITAPI